MELDELLRSLEERLVQHDNNRKDIQSQLQEICSRLIEDANSFEERINREIHESLNEKEERVFNLIEKLNNYEKENDGLDSLVQQAREELSYWDQYEIKIDERKQNFVDQYYLRATKVKNEIFVFESENDIGSIITKLQENLEIIHHSVTSAQDEIAEICNNRRNEAEEMKKRINEELEQSFSQEDARIQEAVNYIKEKSSDDITEELIKGAKTTLLINQKYSLFINGNDYKLIVKREVSLNWIDFEERKPSDVMVSFTDKGQFSLSFTFFSNDEINVLNTLNSLFNTVVKMWEKSNKSEEDDDSKTITKEYNVSEQQIYFTEPFYPSTTYCLKVRIECSCGSCSQWSDDIEFTAPDFKDLCAWKECPGYVNDENNPRIATKITNYRYDCTIIGNIPLPLDRITSWNIKILKSHNGSDIYVGIAPFGINQNGDRNYNKCGWYFNCYYSTLHSGPPHNYSYRGYGPRKNWEKYVHEGDSVGVVTDTAKSELSFLLNKVKYGVAYEGIPLDKPLVPCVLLRNRGDSVELDLSEVKEYMDSSISVPFNIVVKEITWDSITLVWDAVGEASFYQIEVDGSKFWGASTTNIFTKRELPPETEHNFRVRTVKDNSVSEWSDTVKGRTQKAPDLSEWGWKVCTDNVNDKNKYSVGGNNHRITTNITSGLFGQGNCTIIGNTSLSLNKITSWSIKILKSEKNDGKGIYIGVAQSNISQYEEYNYFKCGWYFDCYDSKLYSGPLHKYYDKEYGPKNKCGEYVHTGDSVGVVMDTTKGDLSFVLNEVNLGVAYEGIPLDKPLVPCVILGNKGDSIELGLSEVKENVDSSISVPFNIVVKEITWDSITLVWDTFGEASFYQFEVDGKIFWDSTTTNIFTKRGLLPDTEHSFRIRTVKGTSLSEWSDVVKGKTIKKTFESCGWKKCPDYVDKYGKYSINENNNRIASAIYYGYCTIIGNTPLSLNKITSWSIKILKSEKNDGRGILIGVAPFDINQNKHDNYFKCGWYFDCYYSTLTSGPPHNYRRKEYGPRKEEGEYVRTGSCVGVVMNTIKDELSYVLNGVNHGVAYEGIPLDNPLVSCVIFEWKKGDSVELVI